MRNAMYLRYYMPSLCLQSPTARALDAVKISMIDQSISQLLRLIKFESGDRKCHVFVVHVLIIFVEVQVHGVIGQHPSVKHRAIYQYSNRKNAQTTCTNAQKSTPILYTIRRHQPPLNKHLIPCTPQPGNCPATRGAT